MSSAIQHSFAGGQISPTLWNRVDHTKYSSGLKKNRNGVVARDGSWMNRAGTGYVGTSKFPTLPIRLIPFDISLTQSYMLEFGDQYIHFINNGSYVNSFSASITSMTADATGIFTFNQGSAQGINANVIASGMFVQLTLNNPLASGVASALGSGNYFVQNVIINTNTTTFTLSAITGGSITTNTLGGYNANDLTLGVVLELVSPFRYTDMPYIKFDQSVDVMTLCCNNPTNAVAYNPQILKFFSNSVWTITNATFWPDQQPLANNIISTPSAGGSNFYRYKITTVNNTTGEESFPGMVGQTNISNILNISTIVSSGFALPNTPGVVTVTTTAPHGLSNGDQVQFDINYYISIYNGIITLYVRLLVGSGYLYAVTVVNPTKFTVVPYQILVGPTVEVSVPTQVLVPSVSNSQVITGISNTNPMVITTLGSVGAAPGDEVLIQQTGIYGLDNNTFIVTGIDSTHVSLNGIDGSQYAVWGGIGGIIGQTTLTLQSAAPSLALPINLYWTYAAGVTPAAQANYSFNIYGGIGGVFGFIGIATTNSFADPGIVPNPASQPPKYNPSLFGEKNSPACSVYYQQRHCYANTINDPNEFWASATGFFNNFSDNVPVADSDSVNFQLVSSRMDPIQNMLDIGNLIIFTQNNEYAILGNNTSGQFGALTPTAINSEVQSFHGCASLRPIRVDGSAVYLQSRGNILRDLNYSFQEDKYKGNDLTIFSKDFFDNYSVVDMDYAETPNRTIWCVRNDGIMLSLTYVKEQDIVAWGYHDSPNGKYQNVCVIPENGQDSVYVAVSRESVTLLGTVVTQVYIERMQVRITEISDIRLSTFMDSAGTYNGTNTTLHTMTLSGGTNWTKNELLTLTCSTNYFLSNYVGQQMQITDTNGNVYRFTIANYTNGQVVTGYLDDTTPSDLKNVATTSWALAVNVISGLSWLNGLTVSVFGDGYVVASPYNASYKQLTVVNGTLTLPNCYAIISVGIPYLSDIKTLDLDVVGYSVIMGKTAVDKWKNISEITAQVVQTRGGFYGRVDPDYEPANSTNNPLFKLFEMKGRDWTNNLNLPPPLLTDNIKLNIEGGWDIHGNVFVRQADPLPICLSSLAYAGNLPLRDNEAPPQQGLPR